MKTSMIERNPIILSEASSQKVQTLIRASHRHPMDLQKVLPWDDGIDFSKPPKMESGSWIYGTPYWENLAAEQRRELLWKEIARDISMFIWLEQTLPPLYIGYINRYRFSLSPEVYEYLMIFSREEITHTLMFRRYMKMAGLELFQPPAGQYAQFLAKLPEIHPVIGILWTLMVESLAELNAIYLTQDDEIDPLTRKMFFEHHIEEVRHIAFGKRVVEDFFAIAPESELATIRAQFAEAYRDCKLEVTYNAQIAQHTSFEFPVAADDEAAIAVIRTSENNRRLNGERFAEMDRWFAQIGIA